MFPFDDVIMVCVEKAVESDCDWSLLHWKDLTGMTLGLHQANEGRRYKVTPSLIGWAQA